jgi:hypothetical protein
VSREEAQRQADAAATAAAKAAMSAAATEATALLANSAAYSPVSVQAVQAAVTAANLVAANPAASLAEIQAAMGTLVRALSGLTPAAQTPASTQVKTIKAGSVKVAGTFKVGKKLTAKTAQWTRGSTFIYRWYAGGKAIKGATGKTLKLTKALKGKKIRVKVTGVRAGYVAVAKTSSASKRIR